MSKKFIEGNKYVFTKKKFLKTNRNYMTPWVNAVNGREVCVVDEDTALVSGYFILPKWCKCVEVRNVSNIPECCYDYRHEAPQTSIVETCIHCGEFIFKGETYFDIRGMVLCKDCIDGFKKVGEEG